MNQENAIEAMAQAIQQVTGLSRLDSLRATEAALNSLVTCRIPGDTKRLAARSVSGVTAQGAEVLFKSMCGYLEMEATQAAYSEWSNFKLTQIKE